MVQTCSVDDCNLKHHAKGFCQHHYLKDKKYGDPLHVISKNCSVDDCELKHFAKGLCQKHYNKKYQIENKEKLRDYEHSEKRRALHKKNRDKPENKAKKKAKQSTPEYKARAKELNQTPERKAYEKRRNQEPKRKEQHRKYARSPKRKAVTKTNRDTNRLKVLQKYSKRLSNSNIPCCNCCGENFHIHFLAIDHIAGKKEMDSEPELVKLGYSSKFISGALVNWLLKNNCPEGFQILCHNCNQAKGWHGKCPHETARKEETFAMMEEQSSFEAGF